MSYTPNNPYIPGDPYSYDLKWLVENIKNIESAIEYLKQSYTLPTVVDHAAEMSDANKIYVYVGSEVGYTSGHWYYFDPNTNLWIDGGLYGSITPDAALSTTSDNAVENRVITAALNTKFNTADIDDTLSSSSTDPVQNKIIKAALDGKQDSLTIPIPISDGGTGMTAPTFSTIIAGVEASKWGRIVSLNIYYAATDSNGSIGTIPDGYRPHHWLYIAGAFYNGVHTYPARITIDTAGTTSVTYFNGTDYVAAGAGHIYAIGNYMI